MPRPWSRYSLKKEKEVSEDEKNPVLAAKRGEKKTIEKVTENDDPQLLEFLQVMQPRVKSKMWANDTLIGLMADQKAKVSENISQAIKGGEKSITLHVQSDKSNVITDSQATEKSKSAAADELMSDMDYFKSRVKKDWSDSESEDDSAGDGDDDEDGEEKEEENDHNGDSNEECDSIIKDSIHSGVGEEDANGEIVDPGNPSSSSKDVQQEVLESGRLFVRNLPYTATYVPYCLFFIMVICMTINILT